MKELSEPENRVSPREALLQFFICCFDDSSPRFFVLLQSHFNSLYSLVSSLSKFYLEKWAPKLVIDKDVMNALIENILLNSELKAEYHGEIEDSEINERLSRFRSITLNDEEAQNFFNTNMAFRKILTGALSFGLFNHDNTEVNPHLPEISGGKIDAALTYFLMGNIPEDCQKEWRRVFNSETDGESWNAFQRSITDIGSTLILIWEKDSEPQHLFGAFSYAEWKTNPKFFGDGKGALISILPKLRWYSPTGYNQNYQYFMHGSQTLLNGI